MARRSAPPPDGGGARWWNAHQHSKYSVKDALPSPTQIVERAYHCDYPAVALTDHGTLAGTVELYKESRKRGLMPVPGIELYTVLDGRSIRGQKRHHLTLLATTEIGWRNLVGLNNLAQSKSYAGYPVVGYNDLFALAGDGLLDGLTALTGCMSGLTVSALESPQPESVINVAGALQVMFDGRLFIELMFHGIETDQHSDELTNRSLTALAGMLGCGTVATADSHYTSIDHADDHTTLKRLFSWSDDPEDAGFSGAGYWMPSQDASKELFGNHWPATVKSLQAITDGYSLRIRELDTFRVQVPKVVSGTGLDPSTEAHMKITERMVEYVGADNKRYMDRYRHEADVIDVAEFWPYMLLVASICQYMRDNNIFYSARGSASGSLVCWLLGITDIDPIKYKLRFDRFLSADRLKPPDIDLDVESERRDEVLEWLGTNYSTRKISLWTKLGIGADGSHGSLLVKWKAMARRTGLDPDNPTDDDIQALLKLSEHKPFSNVGVHPAGVVVVDDDSVLERLPTQYITSSDTTVTAFDGYSIEQMGFVKVDVLSVASLSAVRRALETSGATMPKEPYNDATVYRRIARGQTFSLFQLGGATASRGCRDMKPRKFSDIVAAMALFRPAVSGSDAGKEQLALFMERRGTPGWSVKSLGMHKILADATASTYGVFLYQEQVMEVLRAFGMDAVELTNTLKAIKSSNANTETAKAHMESVEQRVELLAVAAGLSDSDIDLFLAALSGYAEYGFNLSHAVSYARWAYITAWLATHYPAHWWAAELATCHSEDTIKTVAAARKEKIQVYKPHVNMSDATWKVESNLAIRHGLASIDGIGLKAAEHLAEHAPYESMDDLVARTNNRLITGKRMWDAHRDITNLNGVLAKLQVAGALEGLS